MNVKSGLKAALVTAATFGLTVSAQGASGDRNFDPELGHNLGGFTLFAQAELDVGVDSNVYAQQNNEVDDTFISLTPELSLESNWSVHELNFYARNENVWYSEQSSENRHDIELGANARIDIVRSTNIEATLDYGMLTESRGDSNAVGNAAEPTDYDRLDGFVRFNHQFNQLGVSLGTGITTFDYDDVPAIGGGTIDNDDRDRDVLLGLAELNYSVSPDTKVFARGTWNQRNYDQTPPAVPTNRDSDGYEIVGGLKFDVTHLIEGEIFAGYLEQNYDVLPDIDGASYGASLSWSVTPLTTIGFELTRSIEETNMVGASGILSTGAALEVNHELLRNLDLTFSGSYQTNDFEGTTRDEDIWSAGLGVEYDINRHLSATAGYLFETRSSSLAGSDYDRSRAHVGVLGRF